MKSNNILEVIDIIDSFKNSFDTQFEVVKIVTLEEQTEGLNFNYSEFVFSQMEKMKIELVLMRENIEGLIRIKS